MIFSNSPSAIRYSASLYRLPRLTAIALSSLVVMGCTSTPLPPWTSQSTAVQPVTPAPIPQRAQDKRTDPAAHVITTPIAPTDGQRLGTRHTPELPPNQAVAQRFKAPSLTYSTPGLQAGRRAFTTQSELDAWLADIARNPLPGVRASQIQIGASQQGAPIWALVVSKGAGTSPAQMDGNGRPTVLLVGQESGDAPASAEALLVIARELGQGLLEPLLDKINLIVLARLNPDGALIESSTTSNGIDLETDHLTLDTPESRALAQVITNYRPSVILNVQEFPAINAALRNAGLAQAHDAMLEYATGANTPEFITKAAREWMYQPMRAALESQQLKPHWSFTASSTPENPLTISSKSSNPDVGINVHALKNMLSLQIASRGQGLGYTQIQRRVHTLVTGLIGALRSTADRAEKLEQVRSFVAKETSSMACKDYVALQWSPQTSEQDRLFLDATTGLDHPVRIVAEDPLNIQIHQKRARPCGYWISANNEHAVDKLRQLGLQVFKIAERGTMLTESYLQKPQEPSAVSQPADSHTSVSTIYIPTSRLLLDAPPGSFYVPLNQPFSSLAIAALEPDTGHSYFNHQLIAQLSDVARVVSPPSLVFEEAP